MIERQVKEFNMNFNNINLDDIDTSGEPPLEEPQRQYYFMAKCREWVRAESKRLGRPLFYVTRTFGCPSVTVTQIYKPDISAVFRMSVLIFFYIICYILINLDKF